MCHIDLLEEAICLVDKTVFVKNDKDRIEILNERSFAYELYRTWYDLNKSKKNGLVINAEVTKKIESKFEKKVQELFKDKPERFLPDMVLHHGQWDSEAQELICEIKIFNNLTKESLERDIKKLVAYTTSGCILHHHYKHAVFILVNGTKKELTDKFSMEEIKGYKDSPITYLFVTIRKKINVERCSFCDLFE